MRSPASIQGGHDDMERLQVRLLDVLESCGMAQVDVFIELGGEASPWFPEVVEGGVYLLWVRRHSTKGENGHLLR